MRCSWLKLVSVLVIFVGHLCCSAWGAGFDGIPGDYCRIRSPSCCPSRNDDCTQNIMDTKCYCDMFCDRFDGGDCCPDFKAVCRGVTEPPVERGRKRSFSLATDRAAEGNRLRKTGQRDRMEKRKRGVHVS
jgi:hypothetical protein